MSSLVDRASDTGSSPLEEDLRAERLTPDQLLVGADEEVRPTLSVVMPTLNEEEGIRTCIEWTKSAIEDLQLQTEIIVSDSSTDRTPDIAREMGAIVVEPDEPGYGYAYRFAFARARGQYIVMGDADCTYDFTQIPRLLDHLQANDADMVMGSRLNGEIKDGAMPTLHQFIGNPLLTKFLNGFYGAGVSDAHSGFRIFTQDALGTMDLETNGMEFASEMIMKAGAEGLKIVEVPIVYHEREGEETLESFRDGWRHVRFMLVNAPSYLFSVPGVLMSIFGIAIIAYAALGISLGGISLGSNSLIAGSLFAILGTQIGTLGVFAAVASDPIQQPSDAITEFFTETPSLERGATAGFAVFSLGAVYAAWLIVTWATSGFTSVPVTTSTMASFTAMVIGAQVFFSSFFLSAVE